jgi:hypothetical protein
MTRVLRRLPGAILALMLLGAPAAAIAQATTPAAPTTPAPTPVTPTPTAVLPAGIAHAGNTWNWRDHQPTEAEVLQQEKAAGVVPSPAQDATTDATLRRLGRELLDDRHG